MLFLTPSCSNYSDCGPRIYDIQTPFAWPYQVGLCVVNKSVPGLRFCDSELVAILTAPPDRMLSFCTNWGVKAKRVTGGLSSESRIRPDPILSPKAPILARGKPLLSPLRLLGSIRTCRMQRYRLLQDSQNCRRLTRFAISRRFGIRSQSMLKKFRCLKATWSLRKNACAGIRKIRLRLDLRFRLSIGSRRN